MSLADKHAGNRLRAHKPVARAHGTAVTSRQDAYAPKKSYQFRLAPSFGLGEQRRQL